MRRAILLAALAALGCFLLGRLSAPQGASSPSRLLPGSPGPTRLEFGGVGAGYAHSRAGAVAASVGYQRAFADAAVLGPGELRRRVEAVATAEFAPTMLSANQPGARRLAQGVLGAGLEEGIPTLYFGVPIFYRVDTYNPRRAVIRSWGFTVVGNASTAEPGAYFGTCRMELAWVQGDWKIADSRASFGPTPKLLTPPQGGEGFSLVDLLEGMRPYAVAP